MEIQEDLQVLKNILNSRLLHQLNLHVICLVDTISERIQMDLDLDVKIKQKRYLNIKEVFV